MPPRRPSEPAAVDALPEPLTAPGNYLRDLPWMPLESNRLFPSGAWGSRGGGPNSGSPVTGRLARDTASSLADDDDELANADCAPERWLIYT